MKIDALVLGEYQTNSYVLRADESAPDCLIIDTGLDARPLLQFLHEHALTPAAVVLTHGHIDHIVALDALRPRFPQLKVYIHRLDAPALSDSCRNLSELMGVAFRTEDADRLLEDGDIVEEAHLALKVIHTPGHSPGGISLYAPQDGVLFTGDTLFSNSIGRTDFMLADMDQLADSIRRKLYTLPDETVCYPGHGPQTTIGWEKKHNQFVR
jgi:hydroxyacylglutathione hydrolase